MGGHVRVEHETRARKARRSFLNNPQPLPHHLEIDEREAGDVPARMRQARNEALLDGIVDRRDYDRNRACRLPQRPDDRRRLADDDVGHECHEFCCVSPYAVAIGASKAGLDLDVAAVCPSYLLKALLERRHSGLSFPIVGRSHQQPDAPHALGLLRTRRERPKQRRRRAAESQDELAAPHSITSSASCWRCSGTLMPSILAVLRLITNSNPVRCTTGRSAGFAPLRILPV